MSPESSDQEVFAYARHAGAIMVTCNRNDFLALAIGLEHTGLIVIIRRRSALSEAGYLLELLARAGAEGLRGNVNFS
ncbi:MAG: DUF5615 family PIN-like protein [Chthoniobacterales bacterium]